MFDRMPIWVWLSSLPLKWWSKDSLEKIVSVLGVPLHLDNPMESQACLGFVRCMVEIRIEVELSKDILIIGADGEEHLQAIVFEKLPLQCAICNMTPKIAIVIWGRRNLHEGNYLKEISEISNSRPSGSFFESSFHYLGEYSSLVLGMNRHQKVETPYGFSEDIIDGGSHRFSKFSLLFPEPDITNYSLHVEVVPRQPHQSHYWDSFLESPVPSSQLMQSAINQDLLYRTVSNLGSLENLQYKQGNYMFTDQTIPDKIDSFGKSQSKPGISLFADCHAQSRHKGITLKPKNTAEFACRNTNMEKVLTSSWRELAGLEHRGNNNATNTWMVSTGFQNIVQSEGAAAGKQRIRWTHELHEQFVEAVNSLGGAMKATPKGILRLMGSQGLTIFHIKSHLQKYRNAKFIPDYLEGKNGRSANQDATPMSNPNGNAEFQISEALRLQMDVQKNLHDHLEFQKKLQTRIEEHANYLRRMFDQQSTSHTFSESHNSDKAIDPTFTECSSIEGIGDHGKMFITKVDP